MSKLKHKWSWFKRTLFGYKVSIVSPTSINHVVHRPFREPILKFEKNTGQALRGQTLDVIIFDEYATKPTPKTVEGK